MPEATPQTFNHFALVRFTEAYWIAPPDERHGRLCHWLEALRSAVDALHCYQVFGVEAESDLIVWSAIAGDDLAIPARFFEAFAAAMAPLRAQARLTTALWGFTQGSQYTKTRSRQEIDPFGRERQPYLVMYPFTKTAAWYQHDRDARLAAFGVHHVRAPIRAIFLRVVPRCRRSGGPAGRRRRASP